MPWEYLPVLGPIAIIGYFLIRAIIDLSRVRPASHEHRWPRDTGYAASGGESAGVELMPLPYIPDGTAEGCGGGSSGGDSGCGGGE